MQALGQICPIFYHLIERLECRWQITSENGINQFIYQVT